MSLRSSAGGAGAASGAAAREAELRDVGVLLTALGADGHDTSVTPTSRT